MILDFDGTILDSSKAWFDIYQEYCKKYNITISNKANRKKCDFSYSDCIEEIKSTILSSQYSKLLDASLNEIAKNIYKKINPREGFIKFLKNRHNLSSKIIIISKEEPALIKSYLKHHKIFEVSEVFQDHNNDRNKVIFYINLSKKYNCNIHNITLVDDSYLHCVAGKQAGVFVIGINDNHSIDRQNQMNSVCDIYNNNFLPLLES
ncbi:phosphoglycolate phosphatase [Capnocytophaga stomatis]|nr:HAD hydrolase-like protein [Capnocytophaga stomatis]GIJ94083.1 phosphoglycolate phosphatase [Capnocytophaga stomatis]GIJ97641.1 phosphoglycolate phosphatase [Capnocytophaga stomatis]GIM49468.1 phosphoglycolate phosphatase [Capnocytophaga stomatis]